MPIPFAIPSPDFAIAIALTLIAMQFVYIVKISSCREEWKNPESGAWQFGRLPKTDGQRKMGVAARRRYFASLVLIVALLPTCRREKPDGADVKPAAPTPPPAEQKRIAALLDAVEAAEEVTFIRNDEEYPSWAARKWIERKYETYGAGSQTAEEFVARTATRSEKTKKPYMVRFADGRTTESACWLKSLLAEIDRNKSP